MNRVELATFLRARRERLQPTEVGLPVGERRRTAGLRRQEVAQLAGISVDYYIRLEQGRGPHPSRNVLAALARALMFSRDDREYLFHIADEVPPTVVGPSRTVSSAIRHLLDGMPYTPAYVVDAKYDVLAWNQLATFFLSDLSQVGHEDRNMIRWMFRQPDTDRHWSDEDMVAFTRSSIADLRAAYGRYPGDAGIAALVTELLGVSKRFTRMWNDHEVAVRRTVTKTVNHPVAGPLRFECQVLHVADTDQRIIVYCAAPGSNTHRAFVRLADRAPGTATAGPATAAAAGTAATRTVAKVMSDGGA
jgi:transcriptional regulator with XRE-family HTH domain